MLPAAVVSCSLEIACPVVLTSCVWCPRPPSHYNSLQFPVSRHEEQKAVASDHLEVSVGAPKQKVDGQRNPGWGRGEAAMESELLNFLNTGPLPCRDPSTRVALGSNRTWFAANVRALATGRFHTAAAAVGNQSINELTDECNALSFQLSKLRIEVEAQRATRSAS